MEIMAQKLSLRSAIFINLNIILGTGIFINSMLLAKHMGPWGAVTYLLVGTLLLPLILAMAQLVKTHKGGSFYDYAAPIHPFFGFLSQWCYFVGKLAACTLGIHIFVSLMQTIFIPLQSYSPLFLDSLIVFLFIALNMLNLRINKSIQIGFFVLKMIPILFILISGIIYFSPENLISSALDLQQLFVTVPFALYAFTGFEATCSLIHTLENPEKDGPKAILYSYGLSVCIAIIFQTLLYSLVGPELRVAGTFLETFPLVFNSLFSNTVHSMYGIMLIHTAIACSALGAAYGVMFSNAWNLYTLAEKKIIDFKWLMRCTQSGIPYFCILTEALIIFGYLYSTSGAQVALQQTNTLALTTTFTLSALGLLFYSLKNNAYRTNRNGDIMLAFAALASCSLLLIFLGKSFLHHKTLPSAIFIALILFGIASFIHASKK